MHLPELDAFLTGVHSRQTTAACPDLKSAHPYPELVKASLPENFTVVGVY